MLHVGSVVSLVEQGGAQLGMLHVGRELRGLGYETQMFGGHATQGGLALFARHGFPAEAMDGASNLQYACSRDYVEWLRAKLQGVDLVHAHMFGSWWAAAQALPEDVPLVASEHNAILWPGEPHDDEMRKALQRVDIVFAHGPNALEYFRSLGFPRERLRSARSPVTGLDSSPLPGLPSPRIVYAGRLNWDKGVDLLIEALALVDANPPTFILGTGPIAGILRDRVASLGLSDSVHFVGWQDGPASWIAGASVCVVPSRHEAWSQTAVLAMGLGVPVIGTAVEGLPAVLAGGRGRLVPAEDAGALAKAITDVISGKVGVDFDAGRMYAHQFTPPIVAQEYSDGYRDAIQNRRRASQ